MKFKINPTVKLEDFLVKSKWGPVGYRFMTSTEIKNLFGVTNYGLKQLEEILPTYRLGLRLKRYKSEEAFKLVEELNNKN